MDPYENRPPRGKSPIFDRDRVEKDEQFRRMYTPCDSLSTFHDLECKHRVKTRYEEDCGTNCKKANKGAPLLCPECVTAIVRIRMMLEGISVIASNDKEMQDADRCDRITAIARKEIGELIKKGYRITIVVPKLSPILQFFNEIPEAHVDGPLFNNPVEETDKPKRPRKRPGSSSGMLHYEHNPMGPIFGNAGSITDITHQPYDRMVKTKDEQQVIPARKRRKYSSGYKDLDAEKVLYAAENAPGSNMSTVNDLMRKRQNVPRQAAGKRNKPRPSKPKRVKQRKPDGLYDNVPIDPLLEDEASEAVHKILEALSSGDKGPMTG